MGFRITMGMKMNTYRYNLMLSTNNVANAQQKVSTHRKFNSYAEDPANATNAWRVRQNFMDNISYRTETKDTTTRYQTAWLTMGTVKTHLEQYNGKTSAIRAANDPTGEAKKELGNVLSNTADTVIQAMNGSKYGDEFVFGGTDGTSPPFSWKGDRLFYRGIDLTPPSMTGGTQKWPSYWGELDPATGIPKDFMTEADKKLNPPPTKATSDWVLDDNGELTGTYQVQQTAAKVSVQNAANNEITLPLKDGAGNTVPQQAVDADGNPVAIKMADGTITTVVDGSGNPVGPGQVTTYTDANGQTATVTVAAGTGAADIPVVDENKEPVMKTENGTVPEDQKQWYIYFRNVETLNKLSGEIQYADLGMGQDKDADGKIVEGTYFNNAIPGINILGYGVDEDGDPKNLALLMKKFDHVLSQVDSNGTVPDELGGNQRVIDLLGKFDDVCEFTLKGYTKIDTEAKFLTSNSETLESQTLNLNEQILDLEQVDLADAITQFMWDYNCYNAALKIGTQLLSQSLLDYMA